MDCIAELETHVGFASGLQQLTLVIGQGPGRIEGWFHLWINSWGVMGAM